MQFIGEKALKEIVLKGKDLSKIKQLRDSNVEKMGCKPVFMYRGLQSRPDPYGPIYPKLRIFMIFSACFKIMRKNKLTLNQQVMSCFPF